MIRVCLETQMIQKRGQILGKRHAKLELFTRNRMYKTEFRGMERQAGCMTLVVNHLGCKRLTIFDITTDQMTSFRQMNPNLVGSPSF